MGCGFPCKYPGRRNPGSMISRMIRSGRSRRHSSIAPFPVCEPTTANPSFSRLYWISEYRSASSSISTIFFIFTSQSNRGYALQIDYEKDELTLIGATEGEL